MFDSLFTQLAVLRDVDGMEIYMVGSLLGLYVWFLLIIWV